MTTEVATITQPPTGPRGIPLLGNTLDFARGPHNFLRRVAEQYGDAVKFEVVGKPHFLFVHPDQVSEVMVTKHRSFRKSMNYDWMKDLLGDGIFTSNGEVHRRRRSLVQPAFHKYRVDTYLDVMVEEARKRLTEWQDGDTRNIVNEMDVMTLRNIGRTMISDDLSTDTVHLLHEGTAALRDWWELHMHPLSFVLLKAPFGTAKRFRTVCRDLHEALMPLIDKRRTENRDYGDFLSMLMMAEDESGGSRLSDNEVFEELVTILTTGHGTIAAVLSWTWYLLSNHPQTRMRLHEEVKRELGNEPPTLEKFGRLNWLHMVFQEVLRLYPPGWALGRYALEDVNIGGHSVPKGATVFVSPFVTHRDPRWFDNPDEFDPDRWAKPMDIPKFAYYPFGTGPRFCIGDRFANLEAQVILSLVVRDWKVDVHPKNVGASSKITFRPIVPLTSTITRW